MALVPWNPFRDLDDWLAQFQRSGARLPAASAQNWSPAVDITETMQEYTVKAELPGVQKDDVKVEVRNGVLSLSGERKSEHEDQDDKKQVHRVERSYGAYRRSFVLPQDVQQDRISAESSEGVLTIHLPKAEPKSAEAATIKVQ